MQHVPAELVKGLVLGVELSDLFVLGIKPFDDFHAADGFVNDGHQHAQFILRLVGFFLERFPDLSDDETGNGKDEQHKQG